MNLFTDFNNTFDATNALCALFLWLLFGFLSNMVNCDLQRMIESSLLVRHTVGVLAFFFLFTLIDTSSTASVQTIFAKTLLVYALFLLTTKSKWYVALPVLVLLMIDQVLKKQYEYERKQTNGGVAVEEEKVFERYAAINRVINVSVVGLIVLGTVHYAWLQSIQHRENFNWKTFFFAVNNRCKPYHPDYKKLAAMARR